MDSETLPIIDWALGTRLAGNNRQLAEEIILLLLKNLTQDVANINKLYQQHQLDELFKHIHKLHGAVCYCGLPRLKKLLSQLETDLKNNIIGNLPSHLHQLDIEVTLLLKHYPVLPTA